MTRIPILYPVGIWRFLTPIDIIQYGDYGRVLGSPYLLQSAWEKLDSDLNWHIDGRFVNAGDQVVEHPRLQFIRPVDDSATMAVHYIKPSGKYSDEDIADYMSDFREDNPDYEGE